MDNGTIVIIIINILVGLVGLLATAISVLLWNKVTTMQAKLDEKASSKIWEQHKDNVEIVNKNRRNIVKIATSLDIDIDE